jgi:hypothetical protein
MRILSLLVVGACAYSQVELNVDPIGGPPLAVGMVRKYVVSEQQCTEAEPEICDPVTVSSISVTPDGDAVRVQHVERNSFELFGVTPGSTAITVSADDTFTVFHVGVIPSS